MTEPNDRDSRVDVNDVVQLDDHNPAFAHCLVVVTELRTWGIVGYVAIPEKPGPGVAYIRVERGHYVYIGPAEWVAAQ